jgi:3-hydroxyisobutyrate dehydrogenase-like beta-hydroxyacid dehydrogenase
LCIRRTLAGGWLAGLVTGLGAATADACYGLLAAGGLTLAAKAGIPAERFLKILDTSTGRNWVAQNWDYWWTKGTPEGKGSLYVTKKDIAMTRDTARAYGLSLPLVEILPDLDLAEIIKDTQAEIKKG